MRHSKIRLAWALIALLVTSLIVSSVTVHADTPSNFNLQVSPSPLVATVQPGSQSKLQLKIYNGGSNTENLKIAPRAFTINNDSTKINLLDNTLPVISSWISFSAPMFTIQPGQWFNEQVSLSVPKSAGFSYSFALVITRQSNPSPSDNGRLIEGSLAVFTLINVNRPGATSDLRAVSFHTTKSLYEYLPTTFSITFRNSGNTIVQPFGNIFVGRSGAKTAISTLEVNSHKSYVLPDTSRTFSSAWTDGFPVYQSTTNPDGSSSQKLTWNWSQLAHMRIGRYTGHLIAVYDQQGRDIPIEGTVSFWVIPWKILLVLLVVVLLVLFALFILGRSIYRFAKRKARKGKKPSSTDTAEA